MKISIGCDHGGFLLKEEVKKYLLSTGREVVDCGCFDEARVDYPVYGIEVAKSVSEKKCDYGILICTTGIGMSIVANKIKGVRAALVTNSEAAVLTREHNNSNVICIGAKFTSVEDANEYVEKFITTEFTYGRHEARVNMIMEAEKWVVN